MNKNKRRSSCCKLQSITKTLFDTDTKLEIYEYGSDAVEAKLINPNYIKQRGSLKLQFIYLNICFSAYSLIIWFQICIHFTLIDIAFMLWIMFLLWRSNRLVEFEKFILCYDFGVHLQVQKFFGKQNRFIPASSIHDLVINEVIEDLSFRYLLIVRTKGKLFSKTPIICVFKEFKPSFKCLSLIYTHINKVMVKNSSDSKLSEHL